MSIWAIVPVKPLQQSKSRLSGVLSPLQRAGVSRHLLARTLHVLAETPRIARVLVISRDPAALALARRAGARTLLEEGAPELNSALPRATTFAQSSRIEGVLVLPTDLPLLTAADLDALLDFGSMGAAVVIAPDRHEQGTNALFVRPPGIIPYAFGPGSFAEHCRSAEQVCVSLSICRRPGFALDLDLPEDLQLAEAANHGNWTLSPPVSIVPSSSPLEERK